MMSSPLSSSAMRSAAPLAPRYEQSRIDSILQPPTPRLMSSRSSSNARRTATTSLRLPYLPRFHPANFPSAQSSPQSTPEIEGPTRAPLSPRTHHRMYSDAQKHLLHYHRDSVAAARATSPLGEKPSSPRLVPLQSPGLPVTPLELETQEEYFVAALKSSPTSAPRKELVDTIIQKEARQTSRKGAGMTSRPRQ